MKNQNSVSHFAITPHPRWSWTSCMCKGITGRFPANRRRANCVYLLCRLLDARARSLSL